MVNNAARPPSQPKVSFSQPGGGGQEGDPRAPVTPAELLRFAIRSARLHPGFCVLVGIAVAVLGCLVAAAVPAQFAATSKIHLMQSSTALTTSLASGRREDPYLVLKGVNEAVLNRENLMSLVRESNVADTWSASRTWPLRFKDRLFDALRGPLSREAVERSLLDLLEGSLMLSIEDAASIRFTVFWREAQGAYELTKLAQQHFLESRSSDESEAIQRAIVILEDQLKRVDESVVAAIADVHRVVASKRWDRAAPERPKEAPRPVPNAEVTSRPTGAQLSELTTRLQEVRRLQKDAIEPWHRYNASLKNQLAEMRATFGPQHPAVRQQEAKISAASDEPPQLAALRREEAELVVAIEGNGAVSARPSRRSAASTEAFTSLRDLEGGAATAPDVVAVRMRLDAVLSKQDELAARLDAARVDLATTRASQKYLVVEEPELPGRPIKPKRWALYLAALAAGLLFGFLAGVLRELASGQFLDSWQVRRLGVDVLAEVEVE